MASTAVMSKADQNWQLAVAMEQKIRAVLKNPHHLSHDDIDDNLRSLQVHVSAFSFETIWKKSVNAADVLLWDVTCAVNSLYKKSYAQFKGNEQRRFVVEKQRLAKRYADWIKRSKYFYKMYIQQLNITFDVPAFQQIAHKLDSRGDQAPQGNGKAQMTPDLFDRVTKAIHSSLIHLGDLSRYRNEVVTGEKNWVGAICYYEMAGELIPSDGTSFHQMAVVALANEDHLDTVYCLYRALVVENPHARATANLELEYRKLARMWAKEETIGSEHHSPAETAAVTWLLKLHAMLYKNEPFTGHDHMETELIYQTTNLIKDRTIGHDVLHKFALINLAAEFCASERVKDDPSLNNKKSYLGFLRLNVRCFFMLLSVLLAEIRSDEYDDLPGDVSHPEKISPVMRLILPTLRHYSIWLVSQAEMLNDLPAHLPSLCEVLDNEADTVNNLKVHLKEMWRLYASTLCLLITTFPPRDLCDLPDIEYLLKEDSDTVGFRPLTDAHIAPYSTFVYKYLDGTVKPHVTYQGVVQEQPEVEMVARIAQLVKDGGTVALSLTNTPIRIGEQDVFYFTEDEIRPTNGHSPGHSMSSLEMKRELSERDQDRGYALGGTVMPVTEFTHVDSAEQRMDTLDDQRMNAMVAELVGTQDDTRATQVGFGYGHWPGNMLDATKYPPPQGNRLIVRPTNEPLTQENQLVARSPNEPQHSYSSPPAELASAEALDAMTGGGMKKKTTRSPFNPNMTEAEREFQVQKLLHPFSSIADSSWNNSSVYFGTRTPINAHKPICTQYGPHGHPAGQGAVPDASPNYSSFNMNGQQHQSSADLNPNALESPSNYGDSRSYEREMLIQYQRMGQYTSPGPQG